MDRLLSNGNSGPKDFLMTSTVPCPFLPETSKADAGLAIRGFGSQESCIPTTLVKRSEPSQLSNLSTKSLIWQCLIDTGLLHKGGLTVHSSLNRSRERRGLHSLPEILTGLFTCIWDKSLITWIALALGPLFGCTWFYLWNLNETIGLRCYKLLLMFLPCAFFNPAQNIIQLVMNAQKCTEYWVCASN